MRERPAHSMKFFCSINYQIKDHLGASGKLSKDGNFRAFNENWVSQESTIDDITADVLQSCGLCAWHLVDGKRAKDTTGALKAGLIIIDVDNQADGKDSEGNKVQKQELTPGEAVQLDLAKKYLSLGYYSPSSTAEWPRFRLVFGLEKEIINPDFYQWFTRQIAEQIPGSDRRATQAVNLFYGAHPADTNALFFKSENFIPAQKIDEAYAAFLLAPVTGSNEDDPLEYLKTTESDTGVSFVAFLSLSVQNILQGESVADRSFAVASALKEIIGWCNWFNAQEITTKGPDPLTTARSVFENVYDYSPDLDGKFTRILNSITDASTLKPALALASEDGDLALWKKLKFHSKETFTVKCSDEIKAQLNAKKPTIKNSIFDLSSISHSDQIQTTQPLMTTETPATPAQLINLQETNRQFSENDIAEVIVNNYGDVFLFDSYLDEFFTYDADEGVWYMQDEQHIKRRIVKTLDTFVTAGVLPRYNAATVSSVFQLLKAKLLRSLNNGKTGIWGKNRGHIAFDNGVLETSTQTFTPGSQKDLYFRTRLNYSYDPKAGCPKFIAWLDAAIGADKVILIRAFCRALLTGYTTGERFLHLIGPGGTGKSTLQQILIALAGFTGTHTSSLEIIETNKFECHNLIGKKLLLLTDESTFNKRLDCLKKITSSSDTLRAERKYGKEVISFKPEVLVCIASNEHISSSDISSGLERRRLTIMMDKVVPPSQRKNLINVYSDRLEGELVPELSGIVTWALNMSIADMRDVLANPVKHVPTLNATNLEALIFNNPYVAWLAECTLYAPNNSVNIGGGAFRPNTDESERGMFVKNAYSELYASYVNFCKSNGYKHSAKPRFIDRLKETVRNVLRVPSIEPKFINGRAVFTGLKLKPYDASTDRAAQGPDCLPSPVEFASNPSHDYWKPRFDKHDPQPAV